MDSLNLKVKTQNLKKLAGLEGQVQIRGFRQGKLSVSKADINATGLADGVKVKVQAAGEMSKPMKVDLTGKITGKAGPASPDRIVLESLKGQFGQLPFSLSQALTWERTANGWRVDGLDLSVASGRIRGKGAVAAKTVSFEVTADKLSLESVTSQNSVGLTGMVDGRIKASGDPINPELKANFHVSNLKAKEAEADGVPPAEVDLDLTVSRGQLTTKVKVGGFGPQPGTIDISFPVKFSFRPMAMTVPTGASLSGKLDAQLNLGLLPGILGLDAQTLTGLARVAVKVGGSISSPDTSGQVVISDAQYENVRYGILLQDINAEIAANGDRLEIRQATASDGEKGKISVRGKMELDSKRGFPFSWQVDLDQAQCVRMDLATATTSGSLDLSGTVSEAKLSGKIVIDPAEVNIPRSMPTSITDLEIIEKNAPASDKDKEKKSNQKGLNLALDVNVEIPGRVFIRGQNLDTEWKGALDIGGTAAKPTLLGKLEAIRGRYDILGKRFRFAKGTVTFNGASPPAPYVDMVAEYQAKDITAQILITGGIHDLDLELQSDPSLPQDEILARVLFGKDLSQISPMQALSLAKATAELTGGLGIFGGKGGGLNVMEKTRKLFELDQLEIKTGESGNTAISAGKYLSEKVYIEAEGGAKPEDQKVSIEIELTPNISLESEVGADSQGSVGINWKMDY
ncbi:MAG: translocation/assembly module TamB [bacterium]|nr:translocation/assembly module TamB [bacterium]